MSRESNLAVFEDTQRLYKTNGELKKFIENSKLCGYVSKDDVCQPSIKTKEKTKVKVSNKRTFQAASGYAFEKRVCVLNFASFTNPGGGVLAGASAQEESLCRVSTLYPCLCEYRKDFYDSHIDSLRFGKMDARYNNDCIYSPDVCVFKTDTENPKLMDFGSWYCVDVVTCAAPNLREQPTNKYNPNAGKRVILKDSELLNIHMERARKILSLASNARCEVMILGAFGCGAFKNPPNVVAEAYRRVLKEFDGVFDTIEFAVYCKSTSDVNYRAFSTALARS